MRRIITFFVDQGIFGEILTVAVIAIGLYSMFNIRREVFPNVNFDVLTVNTRFQGASAQEIEKLVTNPIEQEFNEVDGIKKMRSISIEGMSGIFVWLDPDQTTGAKAKDDLKDAVDKVELPEGIDRTKTTLIESKDGPVIEVCIGGDLSDIELRNIAKKLETELEDIPGVSKVVHVGLRDPEIRVEVSRNKLAQYRLSFEDINQALRGQNLSIPGGPIENASAATTEPERIVRTVGEFSTTEEIGRTVLRANDLGAGIRLKDIANIYSDLEKAEILNRTNGKPSLSLTVLKKEKFDAIDMVDAVKLKLEGLKPSLDPRLEISYVNDLSYYVRRRLNIVTSNLLIGLALVIAILPLMIPFKFAAIIAIGEPFAFLGAILLLFLGGGSINLISMIGLIIVSGILVDDSIVVTENAVRLVEEEKKSPREAAIEGTREIIGPVTASVAVTAVAFLPMLFMSGIMGKFVRQIPIAVITCLAASLIETYFILPGHIAHWIRPSEFTSKRSGVVTRFLDSTRSLWDLYLIPQYLRMLHWSVRVRYVVMVGLFVVLVGTVFLATKVMRFVLFPPEGVEIFMVRADAPVGTSLDRTMELMKPIERAVGELPKTEVENYVTTVGIQQQDPNDPNTKRGSEYGLVKVYLTPETDRTRKADEIIEQLKADLGERKEFRHFVFNRINPGPPTGRAVSLGIRGKEFVDILKGVEDIKSLLKGIPGVKEIEDSYLEGKPELRVAVNPEEAAAAKLSVAQVGNAVRASFEGFIATKIRKLDEEIDVRVSLPKAERADSKSLNKVLIPNPLGNLVPLSSIARIEETKGISQFEHEDNQREVKVSADVNYDQISAQQANNLVRDYFPDFKKKFPNLGIDFGGEDEDTRESFESLGRAALFAIVGIFLILVLTFKNILQPLLILLTIPLGIISAIWAFFLHGMPLSFFGLLGFIALAGVIVNNAVIFIDFVNKRRAGGSDQRASIMEAAKMRVRPIFLTSVTTVIGVLPTAYGIGGLDKFVVPIAMALGWGLFFGGILQAFIFPSAVAILDDFTGWFHKKFPSISSRYDSH